MPYENHVKMQAPGLSPRSPWGTDLGCFGGRRGGPLGPFWVPKRTPKDPKMTQKVFPKHQKSTQKDPESRKSNILGAQRVRKEIFGPKRGSQGLISGPFVKEKIISGVFLGHLEPFGDLLVPKMNPWRAPRGPK